MFLNFSDKLILPRVVELLSNEKDAKNLAFFFEPSIKMRFLSSAVPILLNLVHCSIQNCKCPIVSSNFGQNVR